MELSVPLEIPSGWEKLVNQMFEDINKVQDIREIEFLQIKEKFGELRVYANNTNKEADAIIQKYEHISQFVCSNCGKPARYKTTGYICPWCIDCWKDFARHEKVEEIEFNPILKRYLLGYDSLVLGYDSFTIDCSDIWNRYIGEE